ncbi:MAG: 3'-5' exoribonuclease [Bacteroidales bacterium]|nr:3'-5' exoribonuclease [Bacteroidales bacterium]
MRNILMIDIETTGTKPGCKVLSIGAFGFNEEGQQASFYERINPEQLAQEMFFDEPSTMEWWRKQDESVMLEAFGGEKGPAEVLSEFKQFFYKNFNPGRGSCKFTVWSCGIDFDFPILGELFARTGVSPLWKFWQQRDYRTIKELFPEVKANEGNVEKHNALEDAKAQMRGLRHFFGLQLAPAKSIQ